MSELLPPDRVYDFLMEILYTVFPELLEAELELPDYDIHLQVEEVRAEPRRLRDWPGVR